MKKKVYLVWGMYIGDTDNYGSDNYGSDKLNDVWHMGLFADYEKAIKVAEGLEKVEKHFLLFYEVIDKAFEMLKNGKEPDEVIEKIKENYRNEDGSYDDHHVRETDGCNNYQFEVYPLSLPEKKILTNE